jgi:hypothetical protein
MEHQVSSVCYRTIPVKKYLGMLGKSPDAVGSKKGPWRVDLP